MILYVDVRVPLVPLNNEPRHVPVLDYWRLNHILVMQIEAFDAVKQVNYLLLVLAVRHLLMVSLPIAARNVAVLGRPVLQLERLARGEQADNARPIFLREAMH